MAERISFDVFFSLNCIDLYEEGGGASKPDSNFQILDVTVWSVSSASLFKKIPVAPSDGDYRSNFVYCRVNALLILD